MPSTSKSQQKLFGWALACKRNESDECPSNVKKLADSMSEEELEKYASTSHEDLPETVKEAITQHMIEEANALLAEANVKISDVPPIAKDIKTPIVVDETPAPPPGYVHADKRKDPTFFTPSLFKRPGDAKAKSERRIMDFSQFLKRINYQTHDDVLQKGHGQNLTGKG
jgi:hypothetical protein